ncbi:MAG TPA: GNAT family N-acetyltransferase [Kineosporiaceae bacterium]
MPHSRSVRGHLPHGTETGRAAPVTVRPASAAELDAAGSAVRAAYAADGHGSGAYLDVVADARSRADQAEVAVAVDATGQVVGSVTFALPGSPWAELARDGEAEFRMLGVLPSHRGSGIGAALLEWCVHRARDLGRERLVLSSEGGMVIAQRLYRRRGFARRPELDWSPVPGVELLAFALELADPGQA